ncbi:MAG: CinA family protein, partial [Draconibacterium sp.]|nr:CinA family protein [Draconibacterium sp.]
AEVEKEINKLQKIIPENIYGYNDDTLAGVIGQMLLERGKTLAVAESCTGGYISHLITSISGCSTYYNGSVTSYSNEIKEKVLGVSKNSLIEYGAVSEQVAREMVAGIKKVMNADFAIATTGIAGPTGGTEDKPVGTVWIAVAGEKKIFAKKFIFVGDHRERNIIRSSQTALQILRRMILKGA